MSESLEEYQFINDQISWDLKKGIHDNLTGASTNFISSLGHKNSHISFNSCNSEAYLVLRVPPENRFRYRYDTEMSGTHGSLQGVRTGREKSVPTVELKNYPFEALIRQIVALKAVSLKVFGLVKLLTKNSKNVQANGVTLVTCQENEHYPHPHSLFVKEKLYQKKIYENWDEKRLTKTGHYSDPHYIRVGRLKNDYIARLEGMCIISSKKENFHSSVREKMQMRCFELKHDIYKDDLLNADENENLIRRVETAVRAVDVDFVSLCFEAFREENGKLLPICQPIYSEPIGNAKSAKTGKLKISRINKCSGSCKGGDEIWLLVEKINKKGLIVRFAEELDGKTIWESCIEGDDLILHHQYAIIFKTPPYRDVNIASEVEVLMRLERTTQPNQPCDYSEPITFVYEPIKSKINKGDNLYRKESILAPLKQFQTKRPRTEASSASLFSLQSKRKTDDLDLEGMDFQDSDDDIEQLLFDTKDSFELDQAWGKFNVEEFLKFISSDDMDMPVQKDGISHNNKSRRDFFYKLYLLYSKLDENDIRKLTDQISNFRVSKKEVPEDNNGMEKDQVKDAASTLLTLRSKAMINNNNSSNNNNNYNNNHSTSNNNKSSSNTLNNNEDPAMRSVSYENKTNSLGRSLPRSKTELLNQVLESGCEPELQARSPMHMSVIKFNLSKSEFSNQTKDGKSLSESSQKNEYVADINERNYRALNKEKNLPDWLMYAEKMENVYNILNRNGSWRNLAELWDCSDAVIVAQNSSNPAKYIIENIKKIREVFELKKLKDSLEKIDEKEALVIFNEVIIETFN